MACPLELSTACKYYHGQIVTCKRECGLEVGEQVWVAGQPGIIVSAPLNGAVIVKVDDGSGGHQLIFAEEGEVSRKATPQAVLHTEDFYANEADSVQSNCLIQICPQVPIQPWEADKLQSMATQVVLAMEEDRYNRDYGAILVDTFLKNLGSWRGAEEWAQTESATLHSLVHADDVQSRTEFRHWIENSLVCYLREVQKEVNRGRLAGLQDEPESAASHHGASLEAGSSYLETARDDHEEQVLLAQAISESLQDYDMQEAIALNEAIDASRQDQATSSSTSVGWEKLANPHQVLEQSQSGTFSEFPCQNSDNDDFEVEDWGDEFEELMDDFDGEVSGAADPYESNGVVDCDSSREASAGILSDTHKCVCSNHSCDLAGGCCRCIARAPRPGLVPHLYAWWQQRGVSAPLPGAFCWRFYCRTCADASGKSLIGVHRGHDDSVLPLPFGGVLEHSPALAYENEIVEPEHASMQSRKSQTGALAEYDLSSEDGSWVAVEVPGLVRSASGSSWMLPEECVTAS